VLKGRDQGVEKAETKSLKGRDQGIEKAEAKALKR
jgi:hypothetical protein